MAGDTHFQPFFISLGLTCLVYLSALMQKKRAVDVVIITVCKTADSHSAIAYSSDVDTTDLSRGDSYCCSSHFYQLLYKLVLEGLRVVSL